MRFHYTSKLSLYRNFTIVPLRSTKVKLLVKAAPRHSTLSWALRSAHVRWGHAPRHGGTRPAAVPFTLGVHSPSCSAAALPGLFTLRSQAMEGFKIKKVIVIEEDLSLRTRKLVALSLKFHSSILICLFALLWIQTFS